MILVIKDSDRKAGSHPFKPISQHDFIYFFKIEKKVPFKNTSMVTRETWQRSHFFPPQSFQPQPLTTLLVLFSTHTTSSVLEVSIQVRPGSRAHPAWECPLLLEIFGRSLWRLAGSHTHKERRQAQPNQQGVFNQPSQWALPLPAVAPTLLWEEEKKKVFLSFFFFNNPIPL